MPLRKRFELERITEEFREAYQLLSKDPSETDAGTSVAVALEFLAKTPPLVKEGLRHCNWLQEIFDMNLDIQDGGILNRPNPEITFMYAEEHGWIIYGKSEIAYFMTHPNSEDSFTLPKTRGVGDYNLRMKDAITAMAKQQNKSQLLVWMELVH